MTSIPIGRGQKVITKVSNGHDGADGSGLSVSILSTLRTFVYDKNGVKPSGVLISPIAFKLYENGKEVSLTKATIKWTVPPSETTMLKITQTDLSAPSIAYSIRDSYEHNRWNNRIGLTVTYNNMTAEETVEFIFTKVGDTGAVGPSGSNGINGKTYTTNVIGNASFMYNGGGKIPKPSYNEYSLIITENGVDVSSRYTANQIEWKIENNRNSMLVFTDNKEVSSVLGKTVKVSAIDNYDENKTSNFIRATIKDDVNGVLLTDIIPIIISKNGLNGTDGTPGINGEDGLTYYTWIKYADTPTSGMSDNPTGKKYMGVAYNQLSQIESSDYKAYAWSLIKGTDGIPGANGQDGITYYTWIKYADTPTSGMTQSPEGKEYIGIAYNKTTVVESLDYSDYAWSLIKGEDGRPGINGENGETYYTWIKYADTPTTGMSDSPDGKNYIGIAYNKTTPTESTSYSQYAWSLIKGTDGSNGADGFTPSIIVSGGVRGITYAANGRHPDPGTIVTPFTVEFQINGSTVSDYSVKWTSAGCLSGNSTANFFAPTILSAFSQGNSGTFVKIEIVYRGQRFEQTIPIAATKHAGGLDWIEDWDSTKTQIKDKSVLTPRLFAGSNTGTPSSPNITGVAIGQDVLGGTTNSIGIVGYKRNRPVFQLGTNGDFFVGDSWGDNGIGGGLRYNSEAKTLEINAKVTIGAGSTMAGKDVSTVVENADKGVIANDKIDNLQVGGRNLILNSDIEIFGTDEYHRFSTVEDILKNTTPPYQIALSMDIDLQDAVGEQGRGGAELSCILDNDERAYFSAWENTSLAPKTLSKRLVSIIKVDRKIKTIDAMGMYIQRITSGTVRLGKPKLEISDVPTSWTVAPEDIDSSITNASDIANSALAGLESGREQWDETSERVDNWTTPGQTTIDGGMIETNSIKANKINVRGLTVHRDGGEGDTTFAVTEDGEILVDGLLQSSNFNNTESTGYRIEPSGSAVFNQVQIRGEVQLPNAGMTNYAGLRGGANLIPYTDFTDDFTGQYSVFGANVVKEYNSIEKCIRCYNTTLDSADDGVGLITPKIKGGLLANTNYTLSFKARSSANTSILDYVYIMSNVTGVPNIKLQDIEIGPFDSWNETQSITFSVNENMPEASILLGFMDAVITNTNFKGFQFKNLKLEMGSKNTLWCPASANEVNHVRIWAGTTFENRGIANFRVYQNGDVFANNGTFGGTIVGNVDSGMVHIHNDEIVVNSVQSYIDNESGLIRTARTRDWRPNPYLRLGKGESFIDTNFTLGSPNDRKLFFYKEGSDTGVFNVEGKSRFNIVNGGGLSEFRFNCDKTGVESGLVISATRNGGVHVIRHSSLEENKGTLVFDSEGSSPGHKGDFAFTRKDFVDSVKVLIDGELEVKDSVKTSKNNIEMKMQSDGWGWYAN